MKHRAVTLYYKLISVQINEKQSENSHYIVASFEMLIEQQAGVVIIMTTVYTQETIFQAIKSALCY